METIIGAALGSDLPEEIPLTGSIQFDDSGRIIE
jgi:hypothetical protein